MLKKMSNHKIRFLSLFFLLVGLVLVRVFEDDLFYDPFLQFFKSNTKNRLLPNFDGLKLFFGLFLRYLFNSLLSLGIIYLLFRQTQLVKFSAVLFLVLFAILILLFYIVLCFSNQPDYLILFYLRRFLIQPLFLILFVPAFYYQQISK
jgi:exosortase F-associated protein